MSEMTEMITDTCFNLFELNGKLNQTFFRRYEGEGERDILERGVWRDGRTTQIDKHYLMVKWILCFILLPGSAFEIEYLGIFSAHSAMLNMMTI